MLFMLWRMWTNVGSSVTRLGNLLDFGTLFKAFANNYLPKTPTFFSNFCKGAKSLIFLVKSFWGNFYRHLAIIFWSHWLLATVVHLAVNVSKQQVSIFVIVTRISAQTFLLMIVFNLVNTTKTKCFCHSPFVFLKKMGQSRPLFSLFSSFLYSWQ